VGKQVALGLPFEIALEKLGHSPQEIVRILAIREEEELLQTAALVTIERPVLQQLPAVDDGS